MQCPHCQIPVAVSLHTSGTQSIRVDYPRYVRVRGITMELTGYLKGGVGVTYWSRNDDWEIDAHYDNGKLITGRSSKTLTHLIGTEVRVATKEEWAKEQLHTPKP